MNPTHFSVSQINPSLLPAMQPNQIGANPSGAFQQFHQAFQRLQSQESQKLEHQRMAPAQYAQPQSQTSQQQQFLQMMQKAGMPAENIGGDILGQKYNLGDPSGSQAGIVNIHSQQQGLSFPGVPENEQGRRRLLQK